jgi:hypothetical protein
MAFLHSLMLLSEGRRTRTDPGFAVGTGLHKGNRPGGMAKWQL